MVHVCSWRHVRTFDNFFRQFIHKPEKIFKSYVEPGMSVMDIGCGAGFASIGLARMVGDGGRVVFADVQPEMLEMVKKRAEKAGLDCRIQPHLCREDSLDVNETFDFINAFWMVHEVPDTRSFMREVHSCLNPGGRLFVAEPRFHVAKKGFQQMVETAHGEGFAVCDKPRIHFSLAVVFKKDKVRQDAAVKGADSEIDYNDKT